MRGELFWPLITGGHQRNAAPDPRSSRRANCGHQHDLISIEPETAGGAESKSQFQNNENVTPQTHANRARTQLDAPTTGKALSSLARLARGNFLNNITERNIHSCECATKGWLDGYNVNTNQSASKSSKWAIPERRPLITHWGGLWGTVKSRLPSWKLLQNWCFCGMLEMSDRLDSPTEVCTGRAVFPRRRVSLKKNPFLNRALSSLVEFCHRLEGEELAVQTEMFLHRCCSHVEKMLQKNLVPQFENYELKRIIIHHKQKR